MTENTDKNILDVVGMSDLLDGLSGTDAETESSLFNYIQKTRNVIAEKPDMFESQQNSTQMLQMFDYLIAHWHINKIEAIKVLAAKEKQLLRAGYISYDASDLNISDVTENSGFFNALAELYEDEIDLLDGLFSKLKQRRTERKERRQERREERKSKTFKEKFRGFVSKANKFNPVTLAVRNALRGVLALNFLGVSTILMKNDAKAKEALAKVKKMYKGMGGKESKLLETLNKAKSRKALFNKKVQSDMESGKFKGIEGLGETVTIGSMMVAAGAFFLKIWNWIKGAGFQVKEGQQGKLEVFKDTVNNVFRKEDKQDTHPVKQETPTDNEENILLNTKSNDNTGKSYNSKNNNKKAKWKKPLIAVGVLLGLAGIGYGVYSVNTKKKENSKLGSIMLQ
jgi:hypothetical protein